MFSPRRYYSDPISIDLSARFMRTTGCRIRNGTHLLVVRVIRSRRLTPKRPPTAPNFRVRGAQLSNNLSRVLYEDRRTRDLVFIRSAAMLGRRGTRHNILMARSAVELLHMGPARQAGHLDAVGSAVLY
jgi:hypothetical protein